MVAALAVFALANVAAALAPGYWWLMAARIAAAPCAAVITSAAFASAGAGAPPGEQGRYLAVVTAGMTAALFTGVPVRTWLGGALGWRAAFWLIAAVGAVAAVALPVTAPVVPGERPTPLRRRLSPLRSPAVLRLVAVAFLTASGGLMFQTYLSAYAAEVPSASHRLLSALLLLVGASGLTGALLTGRVTDAWGRGAACGWWSVAMPSPWGWRPWSSAVWTTGTCWPW